MIEIAYPLCDKHFPNGSVGIVYPCRSAPADR